MKKRYIKPMIGFEDFTLSANIATGCGTKVNSPSQDQCGIDQGDAVIFLTSMSGCKEPYEDGYGSLCYHNPSDATRMFNS